VAVNVQLPPEAAQALGPGAHPVQFTVTRLDELGEPVSVREKSTFVVPR
jgi:hypothetical protein